MAKKAKGSAKKNQGGGNRGRGSGNRGRGGRQQGGGRSGGHGMSPGKRKFLDEAAKGYEKDKKDRSAREFSSRVVKDLYPSIAAG